eukprot:777300-Rhodomonas_salina.1
MPVHPSTKEAAEEGGWDSLSAKRSQTCTRNSSPGTGRSQAQATRVLLSTTQLSSCHGRRATVEPEPAS